MDLQDSYEFVIVGSGFGGAFAAYNLARAGREVLLVERGEWVERDETCWDERALHLADPPRYQGLVPIEVDQTDGRTELLWPYDTVGGLATFYGAAVFRMREEDFAGPPRADSGERAGAWPLAYRDFAPYYDEAERLLGVTGIQGLDPTEPPRGEYPQVPSAPLPDNSARLRKAGLELGLHPFQLPLAINFDGRHGKGRCSLCPTCDHYLCKLEAKNEPSVSALPQAVEAGARVLSGTRAVRIHTRAGRVESLELVDQRSGRRATVKADTLIVAAGGIGTPHLLLASGIEQPAADGELIGSNLMRHCNGVQIGVFAARTDRQQVLQKRIAFADHYFGDPAGRAEPRGPWGLIQEIAIPGRGVVKQNSPFGLKNIAAALASRTLGLICMAEDLPQPSNRVSLAAATDRFGMPLAHVVHRYHPRDLQARRALYQVARRILRQAGARLFRTVPVETYSHVLGTCWLGGERRSSVVDPDCRLWGLENLYIADASALPSTGSVNPSLTIAANALRVSARLADR